MKKLTAILLTAVMVLSLTVYASAAFVESPSYSQDPTVAEIITTNPDCDIIVTPYRNRSNAMTYDEIKVFERAYNRINYASDVSELCPAIDTLAAKLGISTKDLAVSTLFDVKCAKYNVCENVTISLQSDLFKGFVGLLHFRNNAWEIVEAASVSGNTLTFTIDNFSPFAVVVATNKNPDGSVTIVETPQEAAFAQAEAEVVND